jgi:enoyl-CoA hydratase
MDPVTYERHGAAAVLTIDRQERRNAIDGPTAELIAAAYDRFVADDDARVLVITGAGGVAFCAGADLKAIESFAPRMEDPRGPRRWGVPLVDGGTQRMPRIIGLGRALDLILTGRIVDVQEALAIGLVTEVVPAGRHLERALEIAEALARFPQDTMLADRRAAIEGIGLTFEEGFALEAESSAPTQQTAWAGAARFSGGEGRGGAGAGV